MYRKLLCWFIESISLCHSFVLDPWDKSYRVHDVFTDEEIAEIKSTKKKILPQMPDELLTYLKSYKKVYRVGISGWYCLAVAHTDYAYIF